MSGDKGWSQALLIGGGMVAAGGILYYLYSSSSVGSYAHGPDLLSHNSMTNLFPFVATGLSAV